jgi:hypothetical protein
MSLASLLKKLGDEHGLQIDDNELEALGLSIDETEIPQLDVLGDTLSGEAAGAVEIFLAAPQAKAVEQDGLMWEPIIREGQWAVRPGPNGIKRRSPLKVVAGNSKNQRKQIGLKDIVEAFDDGAIEHVTVPTSHDNKTTENTGFIKGLKIVQATIKDKLSKKDKKVAVLMGGYDIRDPDIKKKIDLGTIASRSAGLLYDYINTETGKKYPVALEHVALTNKPWITGMKSFGRKLVKLSVSDPVGLSLSDEEPQDDELLAQEDALESIELADTSITWDKEDDPDWLRARVNDQLNEARAKKIAEVRAKLPSGAYVSYDYEYPPHYRCAKARPGLALISDGWGEECNYWTAPFTVTQGEVELEVDLEKWTASKKVFIPDSDRKSFEPGEEPLKDEQKPVVQLSRIQLAQQDRKSRNKGNQPIQKIETHPRGGEHMAGEDNALQLSEEARKLIQAAEDRAKAAEEKAERLSTQVDKWMATNTVTQADSYIKELKAIGLDEQHGFTGVLAEVHALMLADDGEPAVQSDHFATDGNSTGELSLSEAIKRIFKAFERGEDGKIKLGEQVVEPLEKPDEKKLGDDGKPPLEDEEKPFDELSEEEQLAQLAKDNPELAKTLRLAIPSANGGGDK